MEEHPTTFLLDRRRDPSFKTWAGIRNDGLKLIATRDLGADVKVEVAIATDDGKVVGLREAGLQLERPRSDE